MLHPYFSSGLSWQVHLADAMAEALPRDARILVVHGHRSCAGTRGLVERTMAKEEVEEMVTKHFITVASDSEQPEPELAALLAQLPRREPTPVCIYLDAGGKLLSSTAGGRPAAVLLNDLLGAISKR
jgi:hypothetical protein